LKPDIVGLDGTFWIWETLEDAIKPDIYKLSPKQYVDMKRGFAKYMTGSQDLWLYID